MTMQATNRRVKKSFTLAPDVLAFVVETRRKRKIGSDSEALNSLLHEQMLEAKRREIDASIKEYYDNASEEELQEQKEWAEGAARSMFLGVSE
ncbi:MAG TPA: hypothetical protein VG267_15280 [Terracidiphilus sp.]|jgi:hypothetical protein|nr:hypothetical protein [Terracidiphilus sp.]